MNLEVKKRNESLKISKVQNDLRFKLGIYTSHSDDKIRNFCSSKTVVLNPIGATGSGKSTERVLVIKNAVNPLPYFNVVVTQPRRLAAEIVANRIASIDGTVVGKGVQLLHGMKKVGDPRYADICVCTSFFLLDAVGEIDDVPHKVIVVDEVHMGDRLLIALMAICGYQFSTKPALLKKWGEQGRKVVFMTATPTDLTKICM